MPAKVHGFSLLEVLITLVIVAIGLLGLAALMTSNLRNASNSNWRTQAAMLSTEVAERIKSNSFWISNASGNLIASPTYSVTCSTAASTPMPGSCASNASGISCSSQAGWVAMDIREMCSKIGNVEAGGLPQGSLQINSQSNASEGMFYQILIGWTVRGTGIASGNTFQYQTQVRP